LIAYKTKLVLVTWKYPYRNQESQNYVTDRER